MFQRSDDAAFEAGLLIEKSTVKIPVAVLFTGTTGGSSGWFCLAMERQRQVLVDEPAGVDDPS